MARRRDDDDDDEPPAKSKMSKAEARSLLVGPATALQVMAWVSVGVFVIGTIFSLASYWVPVFTAPRPQIGPRGREIAELHFGGDIQFAIWRSIWIVTYGGLGAIVQGVLATLIPRMKNGSNYGMAIACVVLAMLPLCSPICFYLNYLAVAILCLVVLLKEPVKESFRS